MRDPVIETIQKQPRLPAAALRNRLGLALTVLMLIIIATTAMWR